MKPMRRFRILLPLLAALLAGCSGEDSGGGPVGDAVKSGAPAKVAVSNYPLLYFAERIGEGRIQVDYPVPTDVDPAFWYPEAEDVLVFQAADRVLLNGAGYEKWVERVSLPPSKLVDTAAGFRERWIALKDVATHSLIRPRM